MKNFGIIKNDFSEILVESILTKNKDLRKVFQKYIKVIKEDVVLRGQSVIYNNLEHKVITDRETAKIFVESAISVLQSIGVSKIDMSNQKLIDLFGKTNIHNSSYDEKLKELHENIDILVREKMTPKNVETIVEAKEYLINYMVNNTNNTEINENLIPTKILTSVISNKFNDKYKSLSEDERKLVRLITSTNTIDKENLHKKITKECITLANNKLDKSELNVKEKLLSVKERLLESKFDNETFPTDILKLIELKKNLS